MAEGAEGSQEQRGGCAGHHNQHVNDQCFVCGRDNPFSLKGQFVNHPEAGEVWGYFHPTRQHQSFPGRVHGGVCAAIIDETIGRVPWLDDDGCWGVTIDLHVKYRHPTPYDVTLVCKARLDKRRKRMFSGTAEVYDPEGNVCAEGTATYVVASVDEIAGDGFELTDDVWIADDRPDPEGGANE